MAAYDLGDSGYDGVTRRNAGEGDYSSPGTPIAVDQPSQQPQQPSYYNDVANLYQSKLGRAPENTDVVTQWWNGTGGDLSKIASGIGGSGEAQAYAKSQQGGGGGTTTTPQLPNFGSGRTFDPNTINQAISYYASQPGANPSLANDPNYWAGRITQTGGLGADNAQYWQNLGMRPEGAPENWTPAMGSNPSQWSAGSGNQWGGTSVFGDPATQQYEQLLNAMISRLNQPYQSQSFAPAMDYLSKYFQQLQGPAYTPEQMDLQNTQLFDPIMQQRDAARKQILEHFGARGMGPESGPVQQALLQSDQAYERLGTQQRAGVANNAIGMQKQQQAQAAQLGPIMASLEQQQNASNEQRMLQGTNLASIIPQMAYSRLVGANNAVQPLAPGALFGQQNLFQQQGYNQGANYMSQLMQALASIFGV